MDVSNKLDRRDFLRTLGLGSAALVMPGVCFSQNSGTKKLNVLFIAVDDLNDWVGCMGGNPQVKTPNIDRLVKLGATVMNKAYCPATVCCPSRTAIMTGLRPSTTGVYGNRNNPRNAPKAHSVVTLTEYFSKNGYHSLSRGKIFHKHMTETGLDEGQWAYDEWVPSPGATGIKRSELPLNGLMMIDGSKPTGKALAFDWGPSRNPKEQTKDYLTGQWAAQQLKRKFDKSFFMAVGFSKPHLTWHVPREFFDLYPLDEIELPVIKEDDLDDIKTQDGSAQHKPSQDYLRVKKYDKFKEAVQGYLAAISYVDTCIGLVLEALQKSRYRDNTIVMIWGDHGWYLGEKLRYRKTRLWEESARVPFVVRVPGVTRPNSKCNRVVNLIDIYPTLIDLCGLAKNLENEGRSFAPLLNNPGLPWEHPTLTTMGYSNHAVRDERYCYIRHSNGVRELYDHSLDPMEHFNLAPYPQYRPVIERLVNYLPTVDEPQSPQNTIERPKR